MATYSERIATRQCEARAKSTGVRCTRPTANGRNVCYYHGANAGRPIIHGGRSKELPALTQRQRIEEATARADLVNMLPIIATMQVKLEDIVYNDNSEYPVNELFTLLDTIAKNIERYKKLEIAAKAGVPKDQVKIFINRLIYILANAGLTPEQLSKLGTEINKAATETMPI